MQPIIPHMIVASIQPKSFMIDSAQQKFIALTTSTQNNYMYVTYMEPLFRGVQTVRTKKMVALRAVHFVHGR